MQRSASRFQSTPPRRGDRRPATSIAGSVAVSIHAPAKGRPPRGCSARPLTPSFNPRPREGATIDSSRQVLADRTVSIHAPAKGRRSATAAQIAAITMFQSTPPRRGDRPARPVARTAVSVFQSTPPRRGDRHELARSAAAFRFQSTPPRRGDPATVVQSMTIASVSIHAPAKGRPSHGRAVLAWTRVSIHAPAKGRPAPARIADPSRSVFQSTPPRRGDLHGRGRRSSGDRGFNPRPREGATSREATRLARAAVSIHAPAKGRPRHPNWLLGLADARHLPRTRSSDKSLLGSKSGLRPVGCRKGVYGDREPPGLSV